MSFSIGSELIMPRIEYPSVVDIFTGFPLAEGPKNCPGPRISAADIVEMADVLRNSTGEHGGKSFKSQFESSASSAYRGREAYLYNISPAAETVKLVGLPGSAKHLGPVRERVLSRAL